MTYGIHKEVLVVVAGSLETALWFKSGVHNILGICLGSFMITRPTLSCSHWLEFVCTECCHDIIYKPTMQMFNDATLLFLSVSGGSIISQGALTCEGCQNTIWPIFPKHCITMKKFWPRGGARHSYPSLDLPLALMVRVCSNPYSFIL